MIDSTSQHDDGRSSVPGDTRVPGAEQAATAAADAAPRIGAARAFFRRRRWRLAGLVLAGVLLLAAGALTAALARGPEGHVEIGPLLDVGGAWLVSGLIFIGWLVGRFPMVATLALAGGALRGGPAADGVAAPDTGAARDRGVDARRALPRPGAAFRLTLAALAASLLSALLLPSFDLIMLTTWGGLATFVFILAQVSVYLSVTAFAALWTRWDGWLALVVGAGAMGWHRLAEAGHAPAWPVLAELVSFLLPPRAALVALEDAFPGIQPIPWTALLYALGYAMALLLVTSLVVRRRRGHPARRRPRR